MGMSLKSTISLLLLCGLSICCSQNGRPVDISRSVNQMEIYCDTVLVIDTVNNPTICFLLEFENKSKSNQLFFNNNIFDDHYLSSGFTIKDKLLSNMEAQIGSTLHSSSFIVRPDKKFKLLLLYNRNGKSDSASRSNFDEMKSIYENRIGKNWVGAFIANVDLEYKYFGKLKDMPVVDEEYKIIENDISVQKKQPQIIYFEKLTSEDAFDRFLR